MPESGVAAERQGRLGIARTYAVAEVDGLNAKASEDPRGAFISASKKLVEDIMDEWQLQQSRILHGDSRGVRALVKTRTSATILIVDAPYGIASSGPGNLHIEVGETLALLDAGTNNVLLGKAKVSSIALSTDDATITFAASVEGSGTAAASDILVSAVPTATDTNDTSFGAEPHGIMSFVDVEGNFATFENIKHDRWVAQKLTSSTVDETILMKLLNTIRARAGVDWRSNPANMLLICSTGIWQAYGDTLLGLRRFSAPEMTLKGGFTGVKVGNAVLIDDPWCPRGRVYAIHTPDTVFVDLMDFGKVSLQDSPKWQRSATKDAFQAVFGSYWNYGLYKRASMGVISSITDATNYSPIY